MHAERLGTKTPDATVTLRYGSGIGWLEGQRAAVTRRVGRGSITHVGANLDAGLMKMIVTRLLADSGIAPVLPALPAGIDVAIRQGAGKRVIILTNYGHAERSVPLPNSMRDVLGTGQVSRVTLRKYGVAVPEQPVPAGQ